MAARTLLDTLLLSDFGRLQPDRAREIARRAATTVACDMCGREWPTGEVLCFTCNSYIGPDGRVAEELQGEPNASLRHRVSEK